MEFVFNSSSFKKCRGDLRKNATEAEKKLWSKIRKKQLFGLRFLRQYGVGPYILDFYCPAIKLAVELDGGHHGDEKKMIYDQERTAYLNEHEIVVIRFWDNDALKNIDGVLEKILNHITPPNLPLV